MIGNCKETNNVRVQFYINLKLCIVIVSNKNHMQMVIGSNDSAYRLSLFDTKSNRLVLYNTINKVTLHIKHFHTSMKNAIHIESVV